MSSWKRWNSTKFVRLELTVKTLALFKYGANKLNSMSQNKKMSLILSRSDFSMIWRYYGIPCVHFYLFIIFLFRTNGKKGHLMRMTFVIIMVMFFFDSGIWEGTWSQLRSKFILNNYEVHWQEHFERYHAVEYFTDMD